MTNPSREDVLRVAEECGMNFYEPEINGEPAGWLEAQTDDEQILEFAAAIGALYYAKGAEDMRERAASILDCQDPSFAHRMATGIRALPITPEGEQG